MLHVVVVEVIGPKQTPSLIWSIDKVLSQTDFTCLKALAFIVRVSIFILCMKCKSLFNSNCSIIAFSRNLYKFKNS